MTKITRSRLPRAGASLAVTAGLMATMAGGAAAAGAPAPSGPCTFTTSGQTMTLAADCTTYTTIVVPNGFTLDGKSHTITAKDHAITANDSGAFVDAVVANEGEGGQMNVRNLTINGASTAVNDCAAFNGVAFTKASGSVTNVTLNKIGRFPADGSADSCQTGRAILVDAIGSAARQSVKVENNVVTNYHKNGIDVRGSVDATIDGNTVTGLGPISYVAQNGIVVRTRASATVWSNKITGNWYTPDSTEACGILVTDSGTANMPKQNVLTKNEVPIEVENGSVVLGKHSA